MLVTGACEQHAYLSLLTDVKIPLPEVKKNPPPVPGILNAEKVRDLYGDGSFGGAYEVEDGVMDEIFQAALQDVLQKLKLSSSGR